MKKNPVVMVVDDDSGVRNAMRILLKSVGIEATNPRSPAAWCSTSACPA
jgi:FixJ family two-component response regulator